MLDFFDVGAMLSDEQRQIRDTARLFVNAEVLPSIRAWWDQATFPRHLITRFGELGLLGLALPEKFGGTPVDAVSYGLVQYELERGDSGLRSFASVTSGLVIYPILTYGSDVQRSKYLPDLAAGRIVGCFGLTESDGGSDPGSMRTRARKDGDTFVLNGSKMWITNSPMADVALIWAKDDEGIVRGFLVEAGTPGFSAPLIEGKMSLRASLTGEIVLDECRVPATNQLPGAGGLRAPLSCLTQARYGIAWGALGALESVYQTALDYSLTRTTFGRPIAGRQLVQDKLVAMLTAHSQGLLIAYRLATLKDAGRMSFAQVSMAKRANVRAALESSRLARELLGGNGITTEYPVIRHMLNLETVDTYEGTHDIHTMIVGREITGIGALDQG
ncbi:MAG: acyl-CoA dehydrogenase family protein [Acidimicrobiales bacterium]